jgi:hypothetical protein
LHDAHGHRRADPSREVSVLLSARTPVELAELCPWVTRAYAVDHPMLVARSDSLARLAHAPRECRLRRGVGCVVTPRIRRSVSGGPSWSTLDPAPRGRKVGYDPAPWRLELPAQAQKAAARALAGIGPTIALLPAGSSAPERYPSGEGWTLVLDGLRDAFGPELRWC